MFPRRRSRTRQVRVNLPGGRQLELALPRPLFNRLPIRRSQPTQPTRQTVAALVAAAGASLAYLASLALRRRTATRTAGSPTAPPAHGMADERRSVDPATQPPTSDREPDEIQQLASLNSSTKPAGSPRR